MIYDDDKTAEALIRLEAEFPLSEVARLDPQDSSLFRVEGPWLEVDLRDRDGSISKFAIWKRTGAVHQISPDGTVVDPPMIEGQ